MRLQRHLRLAATNSRRSATGLHAMIKIAFATDNFKSVNQHFGSASAFAIYALSLTDATLLEAAQFGALEQDGNEDKLAIKIALLQGCAAVYCGAAGGSAVRQLLAAGIQPIKVEGTPEIAKLINDLQTEMQTQPPVWLAKALAKSAPSVDRFSQMEAEGWAE